jgi:hypothetical protein
MANPEWTSDLRLRTSGNSVRTPKPEAGGPKPFGDFVGLRAPARVERASGRRRRKLVAWYVYVAHFVAGAVLANAVPHFVHGISGERFQSPFASPPGVGESSPLVNVLWGMANLVVGYVLLVGVGGFAGGVSVDALVVALGILVTAVGLARHFGHVREGDGTQATGVGR